ncbi:MAG: hypothetical protein ACKO0Z_17070 [Betaproteobacteria bacterium]
MEKVKKTYLVDISFSAVIMGIDENDAERFAESELSEIARDNQYFFDTSAVVIKDIKHAECVADDWVDAIPYNCHGFGDKTLRQILEEQCEKPICKHTIDMFA